MKLKELLGFCGEKGCKSKHRVKVIFVANFVNGNKIEHTRYLCGEHAIGLKKMDDAQKEINYE